MVIQHNLSALNANKAYNTTTYYESKRLEPLKTQSPKTPVSSESAVVLSTGECKRKGVEGLSSETMDLQNEATRNQVTDRALAKVQQMLQKVTQLSVKASDDELSNKERAEIQHEITRIVNQIDNSGEDSGLNDYYLLRGVDKLINSFDVKAIDSEPAKNVLTDAGLVEDVLKSVSDMRSRIEDSQNKLEESIPDSGITAEMVTESIDNILANSMQALYAQASKSNQSVLSLL